MFHPNPSDVVVHGTCNTSEKLFEERYPVHKACRDGDVSSLSLLLQTGQPNKLYEEDTWFGWTPVHWAAFFGKLECLCKLVSCPEDCNVDIASSRFLQTPLHIAAFRGHSHCLQWLLQYGANGNKPDHMGETPLHKAARTGSMECISLLSSAGANILISNNNGLTASNVALLAGNQEVSDYLKQMEDCYPNANGFRNNFSKIDGMNGSFSKKDFIKQGLNGGHLPENVFINGFHSNGIASRNGISANGLCHMGLSINGKVNGSLNHSDSMDVSDCHNLPPNGIFSVNGLNGHSKNGLSQATALMGGCKRPYEDKIDEEVKRIRTVEV